MKMSTYNIYCLHLSPLTYIKEGEQAFISLCPLVNGRKGVNSVDTSLLLSRNFDQKLGKIG